MPDRCAPIAHQNPMSRSCALHHRRNRNRTERSSESWWAGWESGQPWGDAGYGTSGDDDWSLWSLWQNCRTDRIPFSSLVSRLPVRKTASSWKIAWAYLLPCFISSVYEKKLGCSDRLSFKPMTKFSHNEYWFLGRLDMSIFNRSRSVKEEQKPELIRTTLILELV